MHICCEEIICKFRFWTVKSPFRKYMKGYRQLFYTFNEIMQQTFHITKCGTTIFTNIDILRMQKFWWDDTFWYADPFILMRLNCLISSTDASFDILTDKTLVSTCFIARKWPFLLLNCLPPENKYQFTMLYMFSIGFIYLILGNQFMHESFTNLCPLNGDLCQVIIKSLGMLLSMSWPIVFHILRALRWTKF